AVEFDVALADADRAKAADPPRIAQQFAFDGEALLAVLIDDKPRPALAELGIDVLVPEIERLQNMAVGIDNIVGQSHRLPPSHPASGFRPRSQRYYGPCRRVRTNIPAGSRCVVELGDMIGRAVRADCLRILQPGRR